MPQPPSIRIEVPGPPVPKARARSYRDKRTGRVRHVTPERTRGYEHLVSLLAGQALAKAKRAGVAWRLDGRYRLHAGVYTARDAGDLDNYVKSLKDALNGVFWHDDRQAVTFGNVYKTVDKKRPRAVVVVELLADDFEVEHL